MDQILTVGFILAASAFFTKVFGLKGYWSLLAAFLVGVAALWYPLLLASFPAAAPWLDPVIKLIAVVVAASGSYDFAKDIARNASLR